MSKSKQVNQPVNKIKRNSVLCVVTVHPSLMWLDVDFVVVVVVLLLLLLLLKQQAPRTLGKMWF
jgi:hypothetical protein